MPATDRHVVEQLCPLTNQIEPSSASTPPLSPPGREYRVQNPSGWKRWTRRPVARIILPSAAGPPIAARATCRLSRQFHTCPGDRRQIWSPVDHKVASGVRHMLRTHFSRGMTSCQPPLASRQIPPCPAPHRTPRSSSTKSNNRATMSSSGCGRKAQCPSLWRQLPRKVPTHSHPKGVVCSLGDGRYVDGVTRE